MYLCAAVYALLFEHITCVGSPWLTIADYSACSRALDDSLTTSLLIKGLSPVSSFSCELSRPLLLGVFCFLFMPRCVPVCRPHFPADPRGRGAAGAGGRAAGAGGCRALLGRFNAFLGFNRTWLTLPVVISLGPLFRFAAPTFPRTRGGGAPRGWGRRGGCQATC